MTARPRILGLFLPLVATAACEKPQRPTPPPIPVTVAKAEEKAVPFEITAPGTVEAIRAIQVNAQVTGVVTQVAFHEGDDVKQGQVLFRIDQRPYRNALQQAEAALARDVAQLVNAKRQVQRYESLAKSEYVTDEQYQAFKTNAEGLTATVKSDSAALDNARLNMEYTVIRAPISGRTGSLLIKEGNLVRNQGVGTMVMLNQIKPIQVRFAVPATFLPEIRARQGDSLKVRISPAGAPPMMGELAFVDNVVDTTTGTIALKGRLENAEGVLWPGQFVTATLVLYVQNNIVVPAPAIMNGDRGPYLFVVTAEQKVATRPVETGRTVEDVVIVNKGIEIGETVVVDGQLRLTPNARVDIKTPEDTALASSPGQNGNNAAAGARGGQGRGGRGGRNGQGGAQPGGTNQRNPAGGRESTS